MTAHHIRIRTRWPFVLAALAATAVTVIRAVLGGAGDLALLDDALAGNDVAGVVHINWHALTAIFASLSIGLFVSTRAPRDAARAIGILAGLAFGATCVAFLIVSARVTGSPFTYFPWIPLGITALLSFFAAARA